MRLVHKHRSIGREVALHHFGPSETVMALTYPGYPHAREPRGSAAARDADLVDYVLAPLRAASANFDEVWLFGHSLGAAVALAVCQKFRPTGAALVSPFASLRDVAGNGFARFAVGERWNSLENVRALHTKCFICHGLLDSVVPATQSCALLARCTAARKERLTLPGMAHALTASAMQRIVKEWQAFAGAPRAGHVGSCTVDAQ